MSYHKSNTGSKDGINGTTHVAQFYPVRGFTCFIDETTPQKIEADKPKSPVVSDVRSKADVNEAILQDRNAKRSVSHLTNKETFGRELKSRNNFSWDGSYSHDKIFNSLENNLKSHPTEKRPPSSIPAKIDSFGNSKRSWDSNSKVFKNEASEHVTGESSPCLLGEEFDVNSAAAASAAVLKDAIQKAQESIRIAKELMERKKEGLPSRSSHSHRNNKKVKDKGEHIIASESKRLDDTNAKDISGSVDYVSQLFSGIRKKSAVGGFSPDFKQNERTYITGNVINDECGKNRGMAEGCELPSTEKKREVPEKDNVMEQQQVHKENTDEKSQELVYMKGNLNNVTGENQTENSEDKVESVYIAREHEKIENCRTIQEDGVIEEIHTDIPINKDGEKRLKDSQEKYKDALEFESDIDVKVNNVQELEDIENKDHIAKTTKNIERDGSDYRVEKNCDESDNGRYEDAFKQAEGHELKKACVSECVGKQAKDIFTRPDGSRRPEKVHEEGIGGMNILDIRDGKGSEQSSKDFELERNEKDLTGRFEKAKFICIETEKNEVLQEAHHESDVFCHDVHDKDEMQKAFKYKMNHVHSETGLEVDDHGSATKDCYNFEANEAEAVKSPNKPRETEHSRTGNLAQGFAEENEAVNSVKIVCKVSRSENSPLKFGSTCVNFGGEEFAQRSKVLGSDSNLDCGINILASECAGTEDIPKDRMSFNEAEGKSRLGYVNDGRQHDAQFEISQGPSVFKTKENTVEVDIEIKTREDTTKNEEGAHKTFMSDQKKVKMDEEVRAGKGKEVYDESSSKVFAMGKEPKNIVPVVKEKEALLKNNEEQKKDREREKEKIAVERAIREARERAFAEARERAERNAVERATAEVRQRVMAEAREKFDKETAAAKLSTEKASVEAKLRSERAAVERATTEARERALEKALSQKSRAQTGTSTSQNHAGPSRDNPMKKSSSSDLERNSENNTDLLQRNKVNVEKHERIMERTAKALAEKNMRDLLAQKELAEKNRLAEALDADIKRWSSGKEGNLRALLSTLQYILGPSSGWQPISLTEIITTNAVKKAYRKATLYVHPDKLQQRGASIQQKYICEKVFDLLKAAWNKFNKEER